MAPLQQGQTPLHDLVDRAGICVRLSRPYFEGMEYSATPIDGGVIDALMNAGCDVNAEDDTQQTALERLLSRATQADNWWPDGCVYHFTHEADTEDQQSPYVTARRSCLILVGKLIDAGARPINFDNCPGLHEQDQTYVATRQAARN